MAKIKLLLLLLLLYRNNKNIEITNPQQKRDRISLKGFIHLDLIRVVLIILLEIKGNNNYIAHLLAMQQILYLPLQVKPPCVQFPLSHIVENGPSTLYPLPHL